MKLPVFKEEVNEPYEWAVGMWRAGVPFEQAKFITDKLEDGTFNCFSFRYRNRLEEDHGMYRTTICYNGGQYEYESESARRCVSRALTEIRKKMGRFGH